MEQFCIENEIQKKSVGNNNNDDNVMNCFRCEDSGREITDLRRLLQSKIDTNNICCSFELSPINNNNDFYERFFAKLDKYHPLFYSLTCHTEKSLSLELLNTFPRNTLFHLIASDLTRIDVRTILTRALSYGVTNIFALRGDSTVVGDFPHAVDLVRFIRSEFGNLFCICVAGYPEMHPESTSREMDLFYLQEKVKAGADFIITQIFFEVNTFINFVNDCKHFGIHVPIIPGIFPITNCEQLEKMSKRCLFKIPQHILNMLQPIKDNDDEVFKYGMNLAKNIIKDIIASGTTCGFHLFTLNRITLASKICNDICLN